MLPKARARRCRYIQPPPPWVRVWLIFDYDRDGAWFAADDAGLPAPTFTVINPENGHGHLAFGLAVPVLLGPRNKHRPKRYLAAVERAMAVRLGADLSYGGFTCKNPLHPSGSIQVFLVMGRHVTVLDARPVRRETSK